MTLPLVAIVACCAISPAATAQGSFDSEHWFSSLEWRCIGPSRGGRASSVAGVVGDRTTYYMGATGGGVWKTTNAGASWKPVTDEDLGTGSIGAVCVAPSDPNVVYAGTGEPDIRGNFSHGDGVYRSTDAGRSWTRIGLEDSRQIGRIVVHPNDPDTVYVAAMGHVFGPGGDRGVFRSRDGGATWENVCFVDDYTGAVDIAMDPNNPRILYAGFWQVLRTPWSLESGGPGSGLYRSTDSGDTWEEVTEGLPDGIMGKVGVSVSGGQRDRVWAIIEAEDGGVFRSDDAGETWTRVNDERKLRQRAWYYTRIHADPVDPDTVYVLNVRFHKSIDGGRTFTSIGVPHGDNHGLWIDPRDNRRIINANDGGANVSFDGGATWSRQDNQPTAQFYRVTTDNRFPYRVYGAQQDNSTASVPSTNRLGRRDDLYAVGGGESGYIAVRPDNPDIVYAGSYGGYLTRYDRSLRKSRNIQPWPENPMGAGAADLVHRFQWTFPIVLSPHDPDTIYVGGEVLFRSTDDGQSWQIISPDLTTNDKERQASSGGPITKDNTSVEYYCTIFSVAESPLERGLLWVGTDDGRVHVSEDAGGSWREVTPAGMGDWPMISLVEASPHDPDTAYLAVTRYKMDDFAPYVYRTRDRGRSWDLVADGIDETAFVRSVREDPVRPGLLYAGTELGVYLSFDAGGQWHSLRRNMPVTPVTDVTVKDSDLVISTQGRSFWILSGLDLLRQMDDAPDPDSVALFTPGGAYREGWDRVEVHFNLPEGVHEDLRLAFLADDDEVVREYAIKVKQEKSEDDEEAADDEGDAPDEEDADEEEPGDDEDKPGDTPKDSIDAEPGMNRFAWDMRREDPVKVPGAVGWPPTPSGPRVYPGEYRVRLTAGGTVLDAPFRVMADPRIENAERELALQEAFVERVYDALEDANRAVNRVRAVRAQIDATMKRAKDAHMADSLRDNAKALKADLKAIEESIIQTKSKSRQDPLNYPVRLNDKIGALVYAVGGSYRPTQGAEQVFARLRNLLDEQLESLEDIVSRRIPEFNNLVTEIGVPAIVVTEGDEK